LKARSEQLLAGLDSIIQVLQKILGTESSENITRSIQYIRESAGYTRLAIKNADSLIVMSREHIVPTLRNLREITHNLRKSNEDMSRLIHNLAILSDTLAALPLKQLTDKLEKTVSQLQSTINSINKGEGTAGKLITDSTLYINMVNAVASLDSLLKDLKANPERYVSFSLISIGIKSSGKNK